MNLDELINKIRGESPTAVANMDDRAMKRLLRATFALVAREVAGAPDGVHKLAALGSFRVRTVEPKGDKPGGRRVVFKPASPATKMGKKSVTQ